MLSPLSTLYLLNSWLASPVWQQPVFLVPPCIGKLANSRLAVYLCSYWQKLAIGTSLPWCHVDLIIGSRLDVPLAFYSSKSLKCVWGLPLHLHIAGRCKTKLDAQHLIEALAPYADSIMSLSMELDVSVAHTIVLGLFTKGYWGLVWEVHLHDHNSWALEKISNAGRFLFSGDCSFPFSRFLDNTSLMWPPVRPV